MQTIEIRDLGPITEHILPIEPGITILTGRNETGKSTAISCLAKLAGRDVDLSVRDGAKQGLIRGLGTTVTVGKKTSRAGEMDAESVEERISLETLVDPKMKQAAASTRARVKALLSLTGAELTLDHFRAILPTAKGGEILAEDASEDPVEMAGKVKRRMETKAREFEAKARDVEVQAQAKAQAFAGLDLKAEHDADKLQEAYTVAVRAHESMVNESKAHESAMRDRELAKDEITKAAVAIKTIGTLKAEVEEADADLRKATAEGLRLMKAIEEIEVQLQRHKDAQKANDDLVDAKSDSLQAKLESLAQSNAHVETMKAAKAMLEAPLAQPPSPDDVSAAADDVDKARKAIENAAILRKAIDAKAEHKMLLAKYQALSEEALLFRNAAESTDTVLSDAVDCETLVMVGGELFYDQDGRREPYARLSDGKRYQVAICEISRAVANGKKRLAVLPLSQICWEGLDHENRRLIHDAAIQYGIAIVTAEVTEGELASAVYQPI